jgi:tetratricopeptide (TPR) repeat protein
VETHPLDPELRLRLIEALRSANLPQEAAAEAQSAAELIPGDARLRVAAAQAWLATGDPVRAQTELNEAAARDANAPAVRALLGEIAFVKGDMAMAIEHLTASQGRAPRAGTAFLIGLARGLSAEPAMMQAQLTEAARLANSAPYVPGPPEYRLAADALDRAIGKLGDRLKALLQRAVIKRDAPDVGPELKLCREEGERLIALLDVARPPLGHQGSHGRRDLSAKLMRQSLADLGDFVQTGDDDALADCRINLGEALKQMGQARALFAQEKER